MQFLLSNVSMSEHAVFILAQEVIQLSLMSLPQNVKFQDVCI